MNISSYIDYTLLKPAVSLQALQTHCKDAMIHHFYAVCVSPYHVEAARKILNGSATQLCTVIGFPLGSTYLEAKLLEASMALSKGCSELDWVINLTAYRAGKILEIQDELAHARELTFRGKAILKIILETGILALEEIEQLCNLCALAEVDYVKTSTGFTHPGAEIEKVAYMRKILPPTVKIKAAGGIKSYEQALEFINAGASRIGTSSLLQTQL
ncbi:MAG: deoxyribose-phosphate aldolase [Bacteroidia bacterium]|nr:deoxyribose-phosphate aldolase [Bacteroidia bacterium]MDW8159337.1 deoxyribose-phosphate aldolase [Bacteroidia bacterium]